MSYPRSGIAFCAKIAVAIFLIYWPTALRAVEKPQVDVWLIDTRCAPVSGDCERGKEQIRYWRLGEEQKWDAADAASFIASGEQNTPTIFLVHGNRTTHDEAVEFAWPIYRWLCNQTGRQSHRVAIWSWRSTQLMKRVRPDVQIKAGYCDSQSYYLADCLRSMKPEEPVSLVGYSFGARIIAGGLHLLGGGTLPGHCLPTAGSSENIQKRVGPIRTFLVAAAFDCYALAPGRQFGNAASQTEEMLVTRNRLDDALRWYPRLYGRGGPEALGYVGPCCVDEKSIRIFDATCCVGKSHHWEGYICCPNIFNVLPHYLFAEE